jgi:hypothetical protein
MEFFKKILAKYIGQMLIIVTVVGLAFWAYKAWRDANEERKFAELIGTKEKYEQLTAYTAKLESDYREQGDLHERARSEWKDVARTKDERIKLLSDATYLIGRHVEKQNGPDYYFETKRKTRNYVLNELRIQGEDSPPIGYIMIKHDGRTYKRNYKFEVVVKNLQTVDEETGHIKVYAKAFLVQKEASPLKKRVKDYKDWKDISYPLEITGGVAYVDPTMPNTRKKFHFWTPHVNGGFSAGSDIDGVFLRPTVDFSVAGWGRSRNDLDFKILHAGFDNDTKFKKPGIHIVPFLI